MTAPFDWPEAAKFGRVIPKSRIFKHAEANRSLKDRFAREVERIVWSHKLAPETINLKAHRAVPEIQVIRIALRETDCHPEVLRAVDRAIPFPLFFELTHDNKLKLTAAYKRPNESDGARWVLSEHFASSWLAADVPRSPFPVALDMSKLYERLLIPLVDTQISTLLASAIPDFARFVHDPPTSPYTTGNETATMQLARHVSRAEAIRIKVHEVGRTETRLTREKQYHRRVEINQRLRIAVQELRELVSSDTCVALTE